MGIFNFFKKIENDNGFNKLYGDDALDKDQDYDSDTGTPHTYITSTRGYKAEGNKKAAVQKAEQFLV